MYLQDPKKNVRSEATPTPTESYTGRRSHDSARSGAQFTTCSSSGVIGMVCVNQLRRTTTLPARWKTPLLSTICAFAPSRQHCWRGRTAEARVIRFRFSTHAKTCWRRWGPAYASENYTYCHRRSYGSLTFGSQQCECGMAPARCGCQIERSRCNVGQTLEGEDAIWTRGTD